MITMTISLNFVNIILLIIFGLYVVACPFMYYKLWKEEDSDLILAFIICFTPFNIVFLLFGLINYLYVSCFEIYNNKKKRKKEKERKKILMENKKRLFELHKDVDPYGEEDWSY